MRTILFVLPILFAASAWAQLPQIRMTGVFPPGAQRGTTVDVTVTAGTDLDEASELVFSHPGLKAVPKVDGNGKPVVNQFAVTADAAVQPGLYDVRVRGLFGISNPRIFRVDTIPEIQETEPNNTTEQAQEVAVNTIVNARSNAATDVDMFRVAAKANQTIVFRSEAALLDSLMQPVLELFDANGRRVAQSRRRNQNEAVIVYTSPADQSLLLKIRDTVYGGSNDYGYRLSVDTRSLVDFTAPMVVQANTDTKVTLYGRHLSDGQPTDMTLNGTALQKKEITVKLTTDPQGIVGTTSSATSIDTAIYSGVDGNLLPFAVRTDAAAVTLEAEGTDAAQVVALPTNISGRFGAEMDEDTFRFDAKKDDAWHIDVLAQRLGSSADPLLIVEQVVKAADGAETFKRLTRQDTGTQNPGGNNLPTLTSDPEFAFKAPADGQYQVRVKDRFAASRGASNLTYSVCIHKPQPDFRVVIFDSLPAPDGKAPPTAGAISLRKGGTYPVPVYAYRSGGHNADIRLTAKTLPPGITAPEVVIPAGKSTATIVFTAAADAAESVGTVEVMAVSQVGDKPITHGVAVATLVHAGANGLPRTARLSGSLLVSVMKDEEPVHIQTGILSADVTQDQQLLVPLKLTRRAGFDNKVDFAFVGQPGNVDVPKVSIEKGKDSAVARFYFKENAPVGQATLVIYATAQVSYSRNPWQVERAKATVAEAVKQLEATKKAVTDTTAAAAAAEKKVTELAATLKTQEAQLKVVQAAQVKLQGELKVAIAGKTEATKQLLALQAQLNAAAANTKPENEDLDAAIKLVQEATAAVTEAAKPVVALTAKLTALTTQLTAMEQDVAAKTKLIADAKVGMAAQVKAVATAKAQVVAAAAKVKADTAAKAAADKVVTAAEAAAKPANKNVRAIAIPVTLNVHLTPGKITAAVPNKGAIKKGATAEVKVTLARKNKFAGPVSVSLVLPDGIKSVTSNTVEIAADKTEGMLTFTAAADAAPGDIANAVIRATADFNGRKASFDVPTALKVTE